MDDGLVSDEATKRRLPLWMLGDQANNKSETLSLSNCDYDDEGSRADEERVKKHGRRPKLKSCELGHDNDGLKFEEESLDVLRRCRERKKTRREMPNHVAGINGEVVSNKKKCKWRSRISLDLNNNTEFEGCVENGDDDDLTMEDLMSIAKEFIQEDEDAQPVVPSKHGHKVGTQSQTIESGSFVRVPQGNIRSLQDQGTSSSNFALENLASNVANCEPTTSGNPTQDILDLFLGPLLKKTKGEKEGVVLTEEIKFTREVNNQSFSVVHEEEPALVTKKKTSLKDKVAMFLD